MIETVIIYFIFVVNSKGLCLSVRHLETAVEIEVKDLPKQCSETAPRYRLILFAFDIIIIYL